MLSRSLGRRAAVFTAIFTIALCLPAAAELPTKAILLDSNTVMEPRPTPVISPDGRQVAYVSRGFVCAVDLETRNVRRLAAVPETWSDIYAGLSELSGGGSANSAHQLLGPERTKILQDRIKNHIGMFQWTASSDAVVYGVYSHDPAKQKSQTRIYRAPLTGKPAEIASNSSDAVYRGPGNLLSRDGRFLVGNYGRQRALIWELTTNKPRATPFHYLVASTTSNRWLGVEKDTRQLVVLNDDFQVIERHTEILPRDENGFDMIWSPDERFVIWREQIGFDHYSNWAGCRLDLRTGERDIFTGDYMGEDVLFTGNRGEFLRVGSSGIKRNFSGLDPGERYVGLVADGRPYMQRFYSLGSEVDEATGRRTHLGGMAKVMWSPDFELFTIGLPRQQAPFGETIHLADRQHHLWQLPGSDPAAYIAPYQVAGFALQGKVLIAYDDTQLFALPIEAIQNQES